MLTCNLKFFVLVLGFALVGEPKENVNFVLDKSKTQKLWKKL